MLHESTAVAWNQATMKWIVKKLQQAGNAASNAIRNLRYIFSNPPD
jgi:hypothetical protein